MKFFLKDFSYFNDLLRIMQSKRSLPINEINLVGGRFSGKSTAYQLFISLASLLPNARLGIVLCRATKQSERDLMDDFINTLENFDIKYRANVSNSYIIIGKTKIRVIGLNSMKKQTAKRAGFPRFANVDYVIKVFEECYEFTRIEHQAIQEAVRHIGDNNPSYLTINVCNPWTTTNGFIEYCNSNARFNENILKETGNQITFKEFNDKETGLHRKLLFHYTNGRVARNVLGNDQIAQIRQYWITDKNRARTADWGMPGYEFGAIYTHELHKILPPFYTKDAQGILGGMDYGGSQNEKWGGKTSCHFGSCTQSGLVSIYGEFVWDNATRPLTTNMLVQKIVDFFAEQMESFMNYNNSGVPLNLVVRVDNANIAIIQMLNNQTYAKGYHRWLSFIACKKYATEDRISVTLALLSTQNLRFYKEVCPNLYSELETAHYDDKPEQKRIKEHDHSLNSFEYMIEPVMYQLPKILGLDPKILKTRGKKMRDYVG